MKENTKKKLASEVKVGDIISVKMFKTVMDIRVREFDEGHWLAGNKVFIFTFEDKGDWASYLDNEIEYLDTKN